ARLPVPCRRRAVWLVNEDADAKLVRFITSGAGAVPAGTYFQAGWNGNEYPTLHGRPVLAIEQAPTLGSVGDITLADLSQYVIIDGGLIQALSVHLQFLNDEAVWRFV